MADTAAEQPQPVPVEVEATVGDEENTMAVTVTDESSSLRRSHKLQTLENSINLTGGVSGLDKTKEDAVDEEDDTEGESEAEHFFPGRKPRAKKEWWGTRGYELVINEQALHRSLMVLHFAVFTDAMSSFILRPNYVFMVTPGNHPDSFDSTAPLGFNAATYFLPMTSMLGTAIASILVGYLSDKHGRKQCILICMFAGVVGSIAKYLLRGSFWGFCAANFVTGLFSATNTVAMAYVSDVKHTQAEKDSEISMVVSLQMVGVTGGGIFSILMGTDSLFTPLFLGAACNFFAGVLCLFYLIEPKSMLHLLKSDDPVQKEIEELEDSRAPTDMDWKLISNVMVGAVADNIGSSGLLPLCLSPLAFNQFYKDFIDSGQPEDIIMSPTLYKWLGVFIALMVVPGAGLSHVVFHKIGAAGGCVLGNAMTGVAIIALLLVGTIKPASQATFGIFFAMIYVAYPFTVISQLSTGPMIDALAPAAQRGLCQGLNGATMAGAMAISPFLLGLVCDKLGTETTIWICVGISFFAALVNTPLMFAKDLKRMPPIAPAFARALKGEDSELVERALRGEWIPLAALDRINQERMDSGRYLLVQSVRSYEEDKDDMLLLQHQAMKDFDYRKKNISMWLRELDTKEKRQDLLDKLERSRLPEEKRQEDRDKLGVWFSDYLKDSGHTWVSPVLYKQMIMKAFPAILAGEEKQLTAENFERGVVNYAKLMNKYLAEKDQMGFNEAFSRRFGVGASTTSH
mmetsp:Transcript_27863/g.31839  ORF Transcript_27863/g.31839 Transcript_27863/m.31839 type:complete len:742 (-) Transcript_27863:255-2480(-)